ncbi:TonB-dependent siderophore receptor [Sphingomonas sp.]|uniref:TonB-dependent receptor plug domain-containing protein n=1 Tax=Sphingomonas sp. TaxID=28214 RepID=UPI0025EC4F71|nr:TonB-dependent receptor [Sphingomonas sp.]
MISSALLPLPALAAPGDDAEDKRDEVVVTATGVEQPASEVGQAITILDRQLIEQRQIAVLSDLLSQTPGVTVTRNGSVGGFTGVRIRGAEAEQTLVLIDGVRVNDPSSPGGGFDFGNLLTSTIERVEVLRGPNSVPWGSRAIGGVINIITDKPGQALSARAQIEGGEAGTVFGTAAIRGGTGPIRASLSGGYYKTDGISSAAIGTERDGFRQYGVSGRVTADLASNVQLDLRTYYANGRTMLDGFPAPRFTLADTPEYSTAKEIYGYAGLNVQLFEGRFRNRLAFNIADINRDNFASPTAPTPAFVGRGRTERYEYQGDFELSKALRAVFGAEHEESRFADARNRYRTGITSGFAQLIAKPLAPLTLTGGIRYDAHRDFGNRLTFGADAVLALASGTTIRGSYGEGFKAPTLFQLFSAFGNRTLRPETATSFDVGVAQRFLNGRAGLSVTYFNRRIRNQIDFDLATFTYSNIVRTRADGVEVELRLNPIDALTVTGAYSFINSRNQSPGANFGRELARRPRQTLSTNIDYRLPFGLALGGTVQIVGDSFDDAGNRTRLDGYALVGARAEMPVGQRLALYARVENLTDERYQVVNGYGTFGRTAYAGVRVTLP